LCWLINEFAGSERSSGANTRIENPPELGGTPARLLPRLWYLAGMRKATFASALSRRMDFFSLVAFGMICLPAFPQDAASAAVPTRAPAQETSAAALPSDPRELMLLAAKTNGLAGNDVQPWHLKASYKWFDEQGNVRDQGTYEELWVSPTKYKRIVTGTKFQYSVYGTENGALFSGDQERQFAGEDDVRRGFLNWLPSPEVIEKSNYSLYKREDGGLKFACLNQIDANGLAFGPTWCLDADKIILRISFSADGAQILHNRILRFRGRFLTGNMQLNHGGKTALSAHLDSIETIGSVDDAAFLPPAGALPRKARRISIAGGVSQGFLIKKVAPDYPPIAQAARVSGTVVLKAIIGKDGRIERLGVISGPAMLQQTALDAVKQWVYRPYMLYDEPVEVETTVNVIFSLGGGALRIHGS
jgi:TonB family protein